MNSCLLPAVERNSQGPPGGVASAPGEPGSLGAERIVPATRARIRIKAKGLSRDPDSRMYVRRHVGSKLGRFAARIQDLAIRLRDESAPHGAPRFACKVAVSLDGGGPIIAERSGSDPRSAFDHALGVMERAVRRVLQRRRHTQR